MKKNIFILLLLFSLTTLAGGIYLAYSFERTMTDFNTIIDLHHVENLREHLLLRIQKAKIALYSRHTRLPESEIAIETHISGIEKALSVCYDCHHSENVLARLDDLRHQVGQFRDAITVQAPTARSSRMGGRGVTRGASIDAHLIGDSLIGKVETMVVTTSEKLRGQTAESVKKAQTMKVIMIALIAAGPFAMIIFALVVTSGVTVPIEALLQATRSLKRGKLEHRISGLTDEFGELAIAFNEMAGALGASLDAIEESEKKYRLLFESAVDAIFILDAEGAEAGRILQANPAAASMHGYRVEELPGMKIQDLDTPDAAAGARTRVEKILRGERIKFELDHRRKDGSTFPVEVSAGMFYVDGHRFILAMDRDISERKRAEHELQRAERIKISGALATGLAHEIKNPLAGIKVSMEVLSEESYLKDEDREVLNKVIGEIRRIEYLMKDLMNFTHPPKPHLLTTDINEVLEIVAGMVLKETARSRAKAHAITLVSDFEKGLPEIMVDPMQLKQIFMNLLLNAVEAMPECGTVTVRTAWDREANNLKIELADTGSGMGPDVLVSAFNPFFTTKAKGTGLGLSITKRLVEENNGCIAFRNNAGGGVTCTVSFPARQPEGALTA